jgi:hypothetical protein
VRSTDVLRRRFAESLATLADAFDPATPARATGEVAAAMARVEQLAPAFRASRLATARIRRLQPADWIDTLAACRDPVLALVDRGQAPGEVRRAIGAARKALREPDQLLAALRLLQGALAGAAREDETRLAGLQAEATSRLEA